MLGLTGSVPLEEMDLVRTRPSGGRRRGWGLWERRQLRERSCLCLTHHNGPSIPTSLRGRVVPGSLRRPAQAPMELTMAAWPPYPVATPSEACTLMLATLQIPLGAFGIERAEEGVPRPPNVGLPPSGYPVDSGPTHT